jgi:hypothetical protein
MTGNEYMKNASQLRQRRNEIRIDFVWNIIALDFPVRELPFSLIFNHNRSKGIMSHGSINPYVS